MLNCVAGGIYIVKQIAYFEIYVETTKSNEYYKLKFFPCEFNKEIDCKQVEYDSIPRKLFVYK